MRILHGEPFPTGADVEFGGVPERLARVQVLQDADVAGPAGPDRKLVAAVDVPLDAVGVGEEVVVDRRRPGADVEAAAVRPVDATLQRGPPERLRHAPEAIV